MMQSRGYSWWARWLWATEESREGKKRNRLQVSAATLNCRHTTCAERVRDLLCTGHLNELFNSVFAIIGVGEPRAREQRRRTRGGRGTYVAAQLSRVGAALVLLSRQ